MPGSILSSSFSDVKATPLHCQVPLSPLIIRPGTWVNLALHMPSLTAAFFKAGTQNIAITRHVIGCHLTQGMRIQNASR
jgi:hypothetical protein